MEIGSRKLAAVMFTDMVGFTASMQGDESRARDRRRRYVDAMHRSHVIHGGTVVQWLGDGALSTFSSAVAAVRTAVDLQREMRRNDPIDVRVGIHIGDVMMEETGLLGDAVNLASRIESFAIPGAVMLSDAIHDQVKNQADLSFVDLGAYRLKNVGRPYRILAVEASGLVVPPSGLLEGKGDRAFLLPVTLPERTGRLFGRHEERKRVGGLLENHRLVTVTGPGGIGKTTLAVAVGRDAVPRFDAVVFLSLAAVDDPKAVLPAIADILEIKESDERQVLEGIVSFLADHRVLLILDNFEQVSDAAPHLGEILSACRRTHLLVASRGPLHLQREVVVPLAPLPVPVNVDDMSGAAAALLADAARRVKSDFAVTPENRPCGGNHLPCPRWAAACARTCRRSPASARTSSIG